MNVELSRFSKSICLLWLLCIPVSGLSADKDRLIVVYNPRLDGSEELAQYYAQKRGLKPEQLLALPSTPNESILRDEFEERIRKPLIEHLVEEGWWKIRNNGGGPDDWIVVESRLDCVVLCHGVPLKIDEQPAEKMTEKIPAETRSELRINRAAVDTELALLPQAKYLITGWIQNPFFGKSTLAMEKDWNRRIVLVTRLDGPNPQAARKLVDGAIAGETQGVWGRALVDMRGITQGAYAIGDRWLDQTADLLKASGWNPVVDRAEPTIADPGPFDSCALYAGWYQPDFAGPMAAKSYRFVPGAVAYHIHSYSAQSLRTFDRHWVGPLVAHGVAATLGCVEEPYLQFSPYANIFFKNILFGRNFAESAYLSIPTLSWQITVVGDPLYRPFGKNFDQTLAAMKAANDPSLPWAILRQANQLAAAGLGDQALKLLEAEAARSPNALYFERLAQLCAERKDTKRALELWQRAADSAQAPIQRAFYQLSLARAAWDGGDFKLAVQTWRKFVETNRNHPLREAVAAEAKAKAAEKGMEADADFFSSLLAPAPAAAPRR